MKFYILLALGMLILSLSSAHARKAQKSERNVFCNEIEYHLNPDSDSDIVLDLKHCKKSAKINVQVGDGILHFKGDVRLLHGGSSTVRLLHGGSSTRTGHCQLSMIATTHGLRLEGPIDCNAID